MSLRYQVVPVTAFAQNSSIIWCDQSLQAAVVDPGGDIDLLLATVAQLGVKLTQIWLTHGHIDHVGGVPELKQKMPEFKVSGPQKADVFWLSRLPEQSQRFGFPKECAFFEPEQWLEEGDQLVLGQEILQVKHIPGHTPGHVVFYHEKSHLLIAGDVLFFNSIGRTDFPQGSHEDLLKNIKEKLLVLPKETTVITGHGPLTTIGREKERNPYLI
ncbi:MBL fold metallo-hydrolase [Neisseria sp. Ec49-e6-T10]|uniref:MBL fold metallo-hydrolase n=1 Tax=Neisseria sp. Ec49-e6-T10 TaxID=3140744 RepID=UPI003EBC1AF4